MRRIADGQIRMRPYERRKRVFGSTVACRGCSMGAEGACGGIGIPPPLARLPSFPARWDTEAAPGPGPGRGRGRGLGESVCALD